jgi:hypothetical protein
MACSEFVSKNWPNRNSVAKLTPATTVHGGQRNIALNQNAFSV